MMQDPAVTLTQELIAKASLTPNDAGCQDLIESRLSPLGFKRIRLDTKGVTNSLFIRQGAHEGPFLAFAGHTDVVPTGDLSAWDTDPFVPTIKEGVLFGRGAADMKSGLATMILAAEQFVAEHPNHKGSIGFIITSDEEGDAIHGTQHIVEYLKTEGIQLDYAVVGEATSDTTLGDTLRIGRRGSLTAELTIKGVQGHVAYPHKADNPIHKSFAFFTALTSEVWDQGNADFPPTSLQIANINAGTGATNVIPGEITCNFNLRFCPELTEEGIKARVVELLQDHELEYDLHWKPCSQPFYTAKGALIPAAQKVIQAVTGVVPELSTGGGTSDGRYIAPLGTEVIEIGPINASIHKINEHVRVDDLAPLVKIHQGILAALLV